MRTRRLGCALRLMLAVTALTAGTAVPAAAQTTIEYYALDAVGSVRVVFDQAGTVVARRDYEPFGAEVAATGTAPNRLFAGLFRDAEAGLDYAQARSYQVRTGRFNAPDPIYAGLFEPQRWNRYAYALNSPATFIDPSGLCALPDGGACPRFTDSTTVVGTTTYPEIFTRPWDGGVGGFGIDDAHEEPDHRFGIPDALDWFGGFVGAILDSVLWTEGAAAPTLTPTTTKAAPGAVTTVVAAGTGFVIGRRLPGFLSGRAPTRFVSGAEVKVGAHTLRGTVDIGPTVKRIDAGISAPYRHDGTIFMNREGLLPKQPAGYYREYVHPTPGVNGPGPQRIVQGSHGELYYTPDHYRTFIRVR